MCIRDSVNAGQASESIRPFLALAERLGSILGGLDEGGNSVLQVEYQGALADEDTRLLTLAVMKGFFSRTTDDPVSYVNAPQVADRRGIEVKETSSTVSREFVNLVTVRIGDHAVAGTLTGLRSMPRLVMIDDHALELPPSGHLVVVRNDDRPGVIGRVGSVLGDGDINITDMVVGRSESGEGALMALITAQPPPPEVLANLADSDGVLDVKSVSEA